METLYPKLIHADFGQFSPEPPPRGWKKLQICGADGRLKRKRVAKTECRDRGHRRSPPVVLSRLLSGHRSVTIQQLRLQRYANSAGRHEILFHALIVGRCMVQTTTVWRPHV
jgi:hypothetical protein